DEEPAEALGRAHTHRLRYGERCSADLQRGVHRAEKLQVAEVADHDFGAVGLTHQLPTLHGFVDDSYDELVRQHQVPTPTHGVSEACGICETKFDDTTAEVDARALRAPAFGARGEGADEQSEGDVRANRASHGSSGPR